jgi:DNA-binding transcriptional LysR family regulator
MDETNQKLSAAGNGLPPPAVVLVNCSGPGLILDRSFKGVGFKPQTRMTSNRVVALLSLAVSGLGVTNAHSPSLCDLVSARLLRELDVRPALPPLQYAAIYKVRRTSEFLSSLIRLARETCHFADVLSLLMPTLSTGKH